jgi:two-component system, LytTR family, response regulator
MTRFRVLVAEDEPLARAMVATLVRRDDEIEVVIECADSATAEAALAHQRIDIALLDIEMPGASGLDLASRMGPGGPVFVFVTAFSRYAPGAFEVEAADYVVKPFTDERFAAALERAKRRVRERRLGELANQLATVSAELRHGEETSASTRLTRLSFKHGDRSLVLNVSEIVWIEAEDYYVMVHSTRGRHMLRASLASLEERLDPRLFLRVHRTAIVNLDHVREVTDEDRLVIVLSNGARVPVSRSRRREIEPALLPRFRG